MELCYGQFDIIEEKNKSKKELNKILKSNKEKSLLWHETIYLGFNKPWDAREYPDVQKYIESEDSIVSDTIYEKDNYKNGERRYSNAYVTTNLGILAENGWLSDLDRICECTKYHERRITCNIKCSNYFYNSLLDYWNILRKFSISRENIINHENEISFLIPNWAKSIPYYWRDVDVFTTALMIEDRKDMKYINLCKHIEEYYQYLIRNGINEKDAQCVLADSRMVNLTMTGFISDWEKLNYSAKNDKRVNTLLNNIVSDSL